MQAVNCLRPHHGQCRLRYGSRFWKFSSVIRLFSTSQRSEEITETHTVECGSSGTITVDIYNNNNLPPTSPLILYLPPGPPELIQQLPPIPEILKPFRTARINYRWFNDWTKKRDPSYFKPLPTNHPFPTPVHDILHAYTYLMTEPLPSLFPPSITDTSFPPPSSVRKFFIYGSHLSGGLATSLALTESISGPRNPILGLIAKDSVFNWGPIATNIPLEPSLPTSPSDQAETQPSPQIDATIPWTASTLHALRRFLFATPTQCFDVFASPVLFFKTPSIEIPRSWTQSPGDEAENIYPQDMVTLEIEGVEGVEGVEGHQQANLFAKPRYTHIRFPPRNSRLKIPRSLFFVSTPLPPDLPPSTLINMPNPREIPGTLLATVDDEDAAGDESTEGITPLSQAQEMVKLMQRSIRRHELEDRMLWDEDLNIDNAVKSRVRLFGIEPSKEGGDNEEREILQECMDV
ncbi:hypothetical protein F5884DRAFT_774807 [Xylogone sp. PMI_703]|nr:hypothetical protein F5884DRAFT_774807 [Xylogone sp. PMI_703]